jgi:hypothetical protein
LLHDQKIGDAPPKVKKASGFNRALTVLLTYAPMVDAIRWLSERFWSGVFRFAACSLQLIADSGFICHPPFPINLLIAQVNDLTPISLHFITFYNFRLTLYSIYDNKYEAIK